MKKLIAVDIDEVLSPFHELFLAHHNATYGTSYEYPDAQNRYFLEEFTGESSDIVEAKLHDFVNSSTFQNNQPLPAAVESIAKLKDLGYEFVVITARPPFYKQTTHDFMAHHFPDIFLGVHTIPHYAGSALTPAAGKLALCQELGAEYLVDDNLVTVATVAEAGMHGIVFGEYHWNRAELLPSGVTRCKDWAAVLEYFDGR
jgi:FMN phosphatase YigB (HAD superfamily)